MPPGGVRRPSTRSTRAASRTRTATASATSAASSSKADYLAGLGIDAVWLSPFYPSALADGGYDVDDYRDVDPRLGTLADFDDMVAALHAAGSRSSSTSCPTTPRTGTPCSRPRSRRRRARRSATATSSATDSARTASCRPADWDSCFGGLRVGAGRRRAVVLPLLRDRAARLQLGQPRRARRVPEDPAVLVGSRRGRLPDRRGALVSSKDLPDRAAHARPSSTRWTPPPDSTRSGTATTCTRSTPSGARSSTSTTRRAPRSPRPGSQRAERRARYATPEGLGQAFNFDLLEADFDAAQFRSIVTDNLAQSAATGSVVHLGALEPRRRTARHPLRACAAQRERRPSRAPRGSSRAARPTRSTSTAASRRALAATLFMLGLPGSAYLYQGEELGLHEVGRDRAAKTGRIRRSSAAPTLDRDGLGRDGCRVPLPWTSEGPSFGFGADGSAHLRSRHGSPTISVEVEDADPASTLNLYRRALRCGTSCRRARPGVDRDRPRRRAALRPPERLAGRDELRHRAVPGRRRVRSCWVRSRTAACRARPRSGCRAEAHRTRARRAPPSPVCRKTERGGRRARRVAPDPRGDTP